MTWKKHDTDWWIRTVRQFSGTIHGLSVFVKEEAVEEDKSVAERSRWHISIRYPGANVTAEFTGSMGEVLKEADKLTREMSLGYDAGRKAERSRFSPDTNLDGSKK